MFYALGVAADACGTRLQRVNRDKKQVRKFGTHREQLMDAVLVFRASLGYRMYGHQEYLMNAALVFGKV